MAGIVGPFLEKANRVTSAVITEPGRTLAEIPFEPTETPYGFIAMVPQNITEKLLVEALERKGGRVEYETTFVSAEQEENAVVASVEHKGEAATIRAAFVVGCDGGRSKVRHAMNVPLAGGDYKDEFLLADIETNEFRPPSEMRLCPNASGPVALFPMSATRWRVVATIEQPEGDAPSLKLVRKILRERASTGIEAHALHWSSYFRIHHRHATELRVGRMFIAGDAAHLHSPFGGQGMNTGLHDAWNLVWKLDLVLRGMGNEALLNSYNAERMPVIRGVIETTDLLTKAMATSSAVAEFLRDFLIPRVSRRPLFQHAFVQRLSGLGIDYRHSPIVEGDGKRWLDSSMRGGCIGSRLLLSLGPDAGMAEGAEEIARSFGDVVEVRRAAGAGLHFVRPDGYLAFSNAKADSASWKAVSSLLEKQTMPNPVQV